MAEKPKNTFSKRQWLETVSARLDNQYNQGHKARHRELIDFFSPKRARFFLTDANRGGRKNNRIINTHALNAISTLKSGMMAGITNPATEWVRLTLDNQELAESGAVKQWLATVTKDMNAVFAKSNLYKVLPTIYGDIGVVAIAAMLMETDFEDVERFSALPVGSYRISNNAKGRVDTIVRNFRMTVRELIQKFAFEEGEPIVEDKIDWKVFSSRVRTWWDKGEREVWVDVTHTILPNPNYDPALLESKFKRYASFYYESGTSGSMAGRASNQIEDANKFLSEKGFDMFRVLVPRWETTGEDAWGTDCPAMKAEGQQRALQTVERRLAQADELGINPPMNYPSALRKKGGSALPGAKNYTDETNGSQAIRSLFDVNFDKAAIEKRIERHERSIDDLFHKKAFIAISDLEGTNRTAFEIDARLQESRLMVAGVLINIQDDLLKPMVDITFEDMRQQERIAEPPEELRGMDLKVEFLGVLARAQKSISLNSLMLFRDNVGDLADRTQDPFVWDKVNTEQFVDEFAEGGGITPAVVVSDEEVAFIKEQRALAEQAAAQQEAIASLAGSAKDLSQTDLSGDNALTALAGTQ